MAKLGSMKYKAMDLASTQFYIEVKVEKMVEFNIRFLVAKILIGMLKKIVHPCKVEIKSYEQSRNRSEDPVFKRGVRKRKGN